MAAATRFSTLYKPYGKLRVLRMDNFRPTRTAIEATRSTRLCTISAATARLPDA